MSAQPADDARPFIPEWTLADRLRKVRRHVGMSQSEIAERLGTNQRTYASWESEHSEPRQNVAVAKRLEALSGVPASWILGLDGGGSSVSIGATMRGLSPASSPGGRRLTLVSDSTGDDANVVVHLAAEPSPGEPVASIDSWQPASSEHMWHAIGVNDAHAC